MTSDTPNDEWTLADIDAEDSIEGWSTSAPEWTEDDAVVDTDIYIRVEWTYGHAVRKLEDDDISIVPDVKLVPKVTETPKEPIDNHIGIRNVLRAIRYGFELPSTVKHVEFVSEDAHR